MTKSQVSKAIMAAILFGSVLARADQSIPETWTVDGKTFTNKAQAVRYIVASGKRLDVSHTQCLILTNKLSFKACPKTKGGNFDNEQFSGLKVSSN